jgi:starch synthase
MDMMPNVIKVLLLAAEAEPFVKVGGLADVAGSLPLALRSLSEKQNGGIQLDVRLVLPFHRAIRDESASIRPVAVFSVEREGGAILTQVFETIRSRMPVYFINGAPLSAATSVYSPDPAMDREKYIFFSLAALEMCKHLDWHPDILHANDWHTSLALYASKTREQDSDLSPLRRVLTIHNLPYMGGDGSDLFQAYGLPAMSDGDLPLWARTQPLPLGIWAADAIVPVSPTYAREIMTPEFGCGLAEYLNTRSKSITGILNGIETSIWNPETDPSLDVKYTLDDIPWRLNNKIALQKKLNLEVRADAPLMCMIGRIDPQKGVDIAFEALEQLMDLEWQFVILGTGNPELEKRADEMAEKYPDRVRSIIRFDTPLSRLLYGSSDVFLMPSRYEPCGLTQMIAMRYGSIPVVHATGGLKDTVEEDQTGFLFEGADSQSLSAVLRRALRIYSIPSKWRQYQRNAMRKDFSWSSSAQQYSVIYRSLAPSLSK